jgi:hypothetical protein
MTVEEIKAIARQKQVKPGRLTKAELVRAIQIAEGNSPCFDSNSSQLCGQDNCLWRGHCH